MELEKTFTICSLTDVGMVRKQNEDNLGFIETVNGDVFVVCDGMGGHLGGKTASQVAVENILGYFTKEIYSDLPAALNNSIHYANEKVRKKASEHKELRGMGTTATLLVLNDHKVYYAHVGDSRIYKHTKGNLIRLTKDHSLVQQLVDQGIITENEAENHPRKNEILQALGPTENINPSICETPDAPLAGDIFMMCSDGLCGLVSDDTMNAILSNTQISLQQKGEQLINLAKVAGGFDNITVQLIQIDKSPFTATLAGDSTSPLITVEKNPLAETQQNISNETNTLENIHSYRKAIEEDDDEEDDQFDRRSFFQKNKNQLLAGIILVALLAAMFRITCSNEQKQKYAVLFYKEGLPVDTLFTQNEEEAGTLITNYFDTTQSNISYMAKAWLTDKNEAFDSSKKPDVERIKQADAKTIQNFASFIFLQGNLKDTVHIAYHRTLSEAVDYASDYLNTKTNIALSYQAQVWKLENGSFGRSGNPEWSTTRFANTSINQDSLAKGNGNTTTDSIQRTGTEAEDAKNTSTKTSGKGKTGIDTSPVRKEIPIDTVPPGKGWNYMYDQWGVCPEFILEINVGITDASGNLKAGAKVKIPAMYSSKQEYNFDYKHFHPDSVGWNPAKSACSKITIRN